jgi:alkanesulfonate monooxygenase SsuD/methylene tetrahydromethanopterin reductase-like flavin-dependent oxidoreductase (luciferase family)
LGVLAFIIGHAEKLAPLIEVYRDAIKQCPKPPEEINDQIAAYVLTHCAESRDEARAVGGPAVEWYSASVFQLFSTVSGKPGYEIYAKMLPEDAADIERLVGKYGNVIDALIDLGVISVGTPDECVNTINSFAALDVDQIITSHAIGGIPHEKVMRSIELFGTEVMPRVAASESVSA